MRRGCAARLQLEQADSQNDGLSHARLTECQHGGAGSEKIRSSLLRFSLLLTSHGKTCCGTEADPKKRHGCAARERPTLQDYRLVRYGRGFSPVGRQPYPKLLHAADTRLRAGFLPNHLAPARATGRDFSRVAGPLVGLEALVSQHRGRPYRGGRQKHWIKVKNRKHPAMNRVMDSFG